MDANVKTWNPPGLRSGAVSPSIDPWADALGVIGARACTVRTHRGQDVPLRFDGSEIVLIVRSGFLTLQVAPPGAPRQVVALLFPGDVLRSSFAPPQAEPRLTSAGAAELWRMRWSAFEALAAENAEVERFFQAALAKQMARQAIHIAALGQFNGEQRVATLLIELALRTGISCPAGGIVFDLPFCRNDIAAYLGLNADTLSRIVSRLRGSGAFSQLKRNRAVLREFRALAALSPAAPSLAEIAREGYSC